MIKLIGIAVVALGFAFRVNTLLVIVVAGVATGLVSGMSFDAIVTQFGAAFVENRYMTLPVVLMLPLVGMLEKHGLRERAEVLIKRTKAATAGRVLLTYSAARQISISLGVRIGEHASAVRPLVAPMAEAAGQRQLDALRAEAAAQRQLNSLQPEARQSESNAQRQLPDSTSGAVGGAAPETPGERKLPLAMVYLIRAHAAAAENIGNFFGEDIFVAVGAVLLIGGFFQGVGVEVNLLAVALWGIPTAIVAFVLMWWRLRRLDQRIVALVPKNER